MLKRQLLGEIASRAALPVDELAGSWQARARRVRAGPRRRRPACAPAGAGPRRSCASRTTASPGCCSSRAAGGRPSAAPDHALLCGLPGWHGEAFRFIDRVSAEHGGLPWAALRERLGDEPWAGAALALVDGEDPAIEPLLEDLGNSMAQIRSAAGRREAERVLGRL